MSITVGTDTYITIAEADAYIATHYVSTNAQRVAWDALTDADKEIYLRNATASIELIPVTGQKYGGYAQALAFPRECIKLFPIRRDVQNDDDDSNVSYDTLVPQAVKDAEAEEALELCSPSVSTINQNERRGPAKNYSVGRLSKTVKTGAKTILNSEKAENLMLQFLGAHSVY